MNQDTEHSSVKENILHSIEEGKVSMQPKWKFVLTGLLMFVGLVFAGLCTLYIASFIVYSLRQNGALFAPGFGAHGIGALVSALPWVLVLVAVVFMAVLHLLVKHYAFSYGRPFFYSAAAIVALSLVGGIVIGFTSFHEMVFERSQDSRLPFARGMYERFQRPPDNLTVGVVTNIGDQQFILEERTRRLFKVIITSDTKFPQEAIIIGDMVMVLGERDEDTIRAEAVAKPGRLLPHPRGKKF